jgi:hypothetical protein
MYKTGLFTAALLTALSTDAFSSEIDSSIGVYLGLKGGYSIFSKVDWSQDCCGKDSWEVSDTTGYGLYAGYKINSNLAVEIEYMNFDSKTTEDQLNAYDPATDTWYTAKSDYESDSYSVYGTYRTTGKIFFKGRLGFTYQEQAFSSNLGNYNLPTVYESGLSGSIGIGTNVQKFTIEADYTYASESLSFYSAGILFNF